MPTYLVKYNLLLDIYKESGKTWLPTYFNHYFLFPIIEEKIWETRFVYLHWIDFL